jgi:cytoplasmic iron level regulating protein YaaA (DUF328/UPF0246 family)
VLLLLPPSEAKNPGGDGPSFASLAVVQGLDDALYAARLRVLRAVAAFCRRTPGKARGALKLPPGSAAADLAANIGALEAATMPALDRFTGVLFAALDVPSMTGAQRVRAATSTLVFSGAFGALTGDEPVPVHRVPASATLPRIGGLATYWRKVLAVSLAPRIDGEQLVVDLRSSDYAGMWQPAPAQAGRVISVRVLEDRGGRLQAVSWSSKHGKGLLARELLRADSGGRAVRTVDDLAAAAGRIGYEVRQRPDGRDNVGLDLVVPSDAPDVRRNRSFS